MCFMEIKWLGAYSTPSSLPLSHLIISVFVKHEIELTVNLFSYNFCAKLSVKIFLVSFCYM